MKPSRFTEEQIILILREQEAGAKTVDVCRTHGISVSGLLPAPCGARAETQHGTHLTGMGSHIWLTI